VVQKEQAAIGVCNRSRGRRIRDCVRCGSGAPSGFWALDTHTAGLAGRTGNRDPCSPYLRFASTWFRASNGHCDRGADIAGRLASRQNAAAGHGKDGATCGRLLAGRCARGGATAPHAGASDSMCARAVGRRVDRMSRSDGARRSKLRWPAIHDCVHHGICPGPSLVGRSVTCAHAAIRHSHRNHRTGIGDARHQQARYAIGTGRGKSLRPPCTLRCRPVGPRQYLGAEAARQNCFNVLQVIAL
jgi:hypothetical protein